MILQCGSCQAVGGGRQWSRWWRWWASCLPPIKWIETTTEHDRVPQWVSSHLVSSNSCLSIAFFYIILWLSFLLILSSYIFMEFTFYLGFNRLTTHDGMLRSYFMSVKFSFYCEKFSAFYLAQCFEWSECLFGTHV